MIYFDNAATTGVKPIEVQNAVQKALKEYSVNPGRGGYDASVMCSEMIYNTRKKLSDFFNANAPERVIFTSNCTTALNTVIKGICRPGDHIVTSSLEHNAVARPLYKLERAGADIDYAEVIFGDRDATVRSFERLIRPDTRLVICTHASNVTGEVLPIREIGKICAERGVPFAVDAAQTAGVLDIDMLEMKIDYLCIAPHKGLYAPMGTGVLIALGKIPETLTEGGTGSMSISYEQPEDYPERFESGTLNVPGIIGISAGLDFINKRKSDNIYRHELEIIQYIYNHLNLIKGVKLYTEKPEYGRFVPTLSFNIRGMDSSSVAAKLAENGIAVRAGLHCAPMAHRRIGTVDIGTVRICLSAFNNFKEADVFINTVKNFTKKL